VLSPRQGPRDLQPIARLFLAPAAPVIR
jgi:hypothetical protein